MTLTTSADGLRTLELSQLVVSDTGSQAERRKLNIAWASGLFDGEGSIGEAHSDKRYRYRVVLSLAMTHREGVERFAWTFPFGYINRRVPGGVRQPYYSWRLTHQGYVGYVLLMMFPYLTVKLDEAALALDYLGVYVPTLEQSTAFAVALRSHKTKGKCHLRVVTP